MFSILCYLKTIFNFKKLFVFRQVVYEILGLNSLPYFIFSSRKELDLPILTMEISSVEKVKCHKESS